MSATLNALEEENDGRTVQQYDRGDLPNFVNFDLARKQKQQRATLGGWLTVTEGLTMDLNYGYFRTAIDQDLLFGTDPNSSDDSLNITVEDEGA